MKIISITIHFCSALYRCYPVIFPRSGLLRPNKSFQNINGPLLTRTVEEQKEQAERELADAVQTVDDLEVRSQYDENYA
ncbi:hypothetical protein E4Q46_21285 [Salmonella enterica]|uniref:Uncharacterized protein n=1 Tax=Salmonella enterica TaxID=28901 RepID=A0A742ZKL5_SALER|nr:hypothetical protein [Salmonella enterica]EBX8423477.1 hypothetical protein [Salmonella enterica subsp. enterica serovar Urbana]ECZ5203573.1 hypothetical protein [Salmonella enterica subsp. enterica serovar Kentucky]EDJ7126636.1 hypothetical protein [Salmonella enterica subsp. enterica serovar Stanley]EAQ3033023.1 hypothetical protein [Salmonella enterica]